MSGGSKWVSRVWFFMLIQKSCLFILFIPVEARFRSVNLNTKGNDSRIIYSEKLNNPITLHLERRNPIGKYQTQNAALFYPVCPFVFAAFFFSLTPIGAGVSSKNRTITFADIATRPSLTKFRQGISPGASTYKPAGLNNECRSHRSAPNGTWKHWNLSRTSDTFGSRKRQLRSLYAGDASVVTIRTDLPVESVFWTASSLASANIFGNFKVERLKYSGW